jgi:hypothetical protein
MPRRDNEGEFPRFRCCMRAMLLLIPALLLSSTAIGVEKK